MKQSSSSSSIRRCCSTSTTNSCCTKFNCMLFFATLVMHSGLPSKAFSFTKVSRTRPTFLSMSSSFDQDKFTNKQKLVSEKLSLQQDDIAADDDDDDDDDGNNKRKHLKHQQRVFDEMAELFSSGETIPVELVPVYTHLAERIVSTTITSVQDSLVKHNLRNLTADQLPDEQTTTLRILDVATGTGALYEYYLAAADLFNKTVVHIVGLDLAPNMVQQAQAHATKLLEEAKGDSQHTITVQQGDIMEYTNEKCGNDSNDDSADQEEKQEPFDAIVMNACFGNFLDQEAVLGHVAGMLRLQGVLYITHPLGAGFVQKLHEQDAVTVPHLLPTRAEFQQQTLTLPLQVSAFSETADIGGSDAVPLYFTAATKVRSSFLPTMIRLRGMVDAGYGRGGKKLGFPTANLPAGLFQDSLATVATGVYYGWAIIEDADKTKKGRNAYQKAVVNVGYSPTFEGKENAEKIVEAHLIDADLDDFYNETMRLQLHAYLRPEIKFPSFPALIAQIKADVLDSAEALDLETSVLLQSDAFLAKAVDNAGDDWVGNDGGDAAASWEFQDIHEVLRELR